MTVLLRLEEHTNWFWHDSKIVRRKLRQGDLNGEDRISLSHLYDTAEDMVAIYSSETALGRAYCRLLNDMSCYQLANGLDRFFKLERSGLSDDELDTLFG